MSGPAQRARWLSEWVPTRIGVSPCRGFIEPASGAAPYLDAIRSATRAVDVNSYLISDQEVVSALRAGARRGVAVHVMVAGNPYRDTSAVIEERSDFRGSRVVFRLAPGRFESDDHYDHAKYVIVDPGTDHAQAILGSSNLTFSGLGDGNRDYDWETRQAKVIGALTKIFEADWRGAAFPSAPAPLVVAPGAERTLVNLIDSSRRSLDIETEAFSSVPAIRSAITSALRRKVSVRIVVPSDLSSCDKENVEALVKEGAKARALSSPYVHAKLIVSDGRAFIGSENFSTNSLDDNREVGIVLSGGLAARLASVFSMDFMRGEPLP